MYFICIYICSLCVCMYICIYTHIPYIYEMFLYVPYVFLSATYSNMNK